MNNKERGKRPTLAELAQKFEQRGTGIPGGKGAPGELRSIFSGLRDLFTKDVTREGFTDLFQRDPQATFLFFAKNIDFEALKPLPWHRRYAYIISRVFIALAFQLSPPRRIAFAVATLLAILGFIPRVAVRNAADQAVSVSFGFNVYWFLAIAIFALLLVMELRDKLTLKADLEIAREIQSELVASGPSEHGQFRIYCRMRPANTVGGDYCDVIELAESDELAVVIGDVAGKGMPAALLMALLQGSLRTLLTAGHRGAELIARLNEYLSSSIPKNTFVTLFYGELNTATGQFAYVNAGHNSPFHLNGAGGMERLTPTSMILGVIPDTPFESRTLCLAASDHVLLFTDGASEASNPEGVEFGEDRLGRFFQEHSALDQGELLEAIVQEVLKHCGLNRPHDDITLVSIRRIAATS